MSVSNYRVVSDPIAENLGALVAALLPSWQPYGVPFSDAGRACQAMIQGVVDSSNLVGPDAAVADGATLAILNSAGADSHNATATVAGNAITAIKLASTVAMVDDTDVVAVHNSAGGDSHNATAEVASGVITDVKFASTIAMVDNSDTVVVHNSAGSVIAGTHAAEVAAGVLTDVKLASTVAGVTNGQVLTIPVTGSYVSTVTVTVTAGVVASAVLG